MCHVYLSQELNKISKNPASFYLLFCHRDCLIHPTVIVSDTENPLYVWMHTIRPGK